MTQNDRQCAELAAEMLGHSSLYPSAESLPLSVHYHEPRFGLLRLTTSDSEARTTITDTHAIALGLSCRMSNPIKATSTKASESAFHISQQSFHGSLTVMKEDRQLRPRSVSTEEQEERKRV